MNAQTEQNELNKPNEHHEPVERFSTDVERILRGEIPVSQDADYGAMLEIAQQLSACDLSGESQHLPLIRQQLMTQIATRSTRRVTMFKTLRLTAAALALFTLAVFTIPPLRTLAQEIIITIGNLIITNAPTHTERQFAGEQFPTPNATQIAAGYSPIPVTLEEASQALGFTVYTPAYLPKGYGFGLAYANPPDDPIIAVTIYTHKTAENKFHPDTLTISQRRDEDKRTYELPVGQAAVEEVTVRGVRGIWIEAAVMGMQVPYGGTPDDAYPVTYNILVWSDAEFWFHLQATALPLDEMLKIAESLQ